MRRDRFASRALLLLVLLSSVTRAAGAQQLLEGRVTRVVDGDTIEVEGVGLVRLLGVDAPEFHGPGRAAEPFAREATDYTRQRLLGQEIRLELDWQSRDRYGRTLAYARLPDGRLFNAALIRDGYAVAYTQQPHRRLDEFVGLEREAREAGRGLWSGEPVAGDAGEEPPAAGNGAAGSAPPETAGRERGVVPDSAAAHHVGEVVTVEGVVAEVYRSRPGNTFLNFGAAYPRQIFSAVVFRPSAAAFGDLSRLEGRRVRVTGRVKLYRAKPEIILEEPSQLALPDRGR